MTRNPVLLPPCAPCVLAVIFAGPGGDIEAPGGDISILFAVWRSNDGSFDATILLDDFTFDPKSVDHSTAPIDAPR